jgi:ribosomal protein S28E/S33
MPKLSEAIKKTQNVADEYGDGKEPPKIMTKNVKGEIRKYDFLTTVQSLEELDKLRFKVWYGQFQHRLY